MPTEHTDIAVLFNDRAITYLFSELLEAQGFETQILSDIKALGNRTMLVTETQFYEMLPTNHQIKCLLVSNQPKPEAKAICLTRPLTEEKVEVALRRFLQ